MIKKIVLIFSSVLILHSCVNKRDLSKNTVIAHILTQPDGLHPFNDNSVQRSYIFNYTQKTLIKLDLESLEYIPLLVKEIPKGSDDNLSFTYEIKDGIKWDDGTQFTAEDVAFSVKIMLCPLTNNSQIRGNYSTIIKNIVIDKENPLKFTMNVKNVNWGARTIFSDLNMVQKSFWDPNGVLDKITFEDIHSKDFKERVENEEISNWFNEYNSGDNSYKPEKLVGLGAYKVTEWETEQYITIERKKNWWGSNDTSIYSRALPEKIIFKIIKEDASSYLALKNQDIDVTTRIGINGWNNAKDLF